MLTVGVVILLCVVGIVLWFVFKMRQSASPIGFAKQLAKAQLRSFNRVKKIYPECPKEEQYVMVIRARAGYSEKRARDIVASAKEDRPGAVANLQKVAIVLAILEFPLVMRRIPEDEDIDKLAKGVRAVIPLTE